MRRLVILLIICFSLACKNSKYLQLPKSLGRDADIYSGYVNSSNKTMITLIGPYRLSFKDVTTDARRKEKIITGINELSEGLQFEICNGSYCAKATATYYTRQMTTDLQILRGGTGPTRIKSEKIFGTIISPQDTLNYEINIRKDGSGYCRLPGSKMAVIRPINKRTGFGKIVNGVGLEYVMDGKVIAAFTQKDTDNKIAVHKVLDERTRICLVAVSVCLNNKLNMVNLF